MASATLGGLIVAPAHRFRTIRHDRAADAESPTLDSVCEHFMHFKKTMVAAGELGQITFDMYLDCCERVLSFFGASTPVDSITPVDFLEYRAALPKTWGTAVLGKHIQFVRSIFKYAYDSGMVDRPVRFGPGFRKPDIKLYRRQRREKGLMMFEAEEIRRMLEITRPVIRAMILLGVNCGFGNADCGRLPFSAIDLERGWVNFARQKTEIDRRCPLWPETVEALKRAIAVRPEPCSSAYADLVFITSRGRKQWCDGEAHPAICTVMKRLTTRLGIKRLSLGFYAFRRTFETIGGESIDQVAVDFIMGHSPSPSDMSAIYRQRIADDRLLAVTEHVRQWLFPSDAVNYFLRFRVKAKAIVSGWEQLPRLTSKDVERALILSEIKQSELARGIGFHPQWISSIICGRAPLSMDGEMRIRAFFEQLSHGKTPAPLPKKEVPRFEKPSDVPLSKEALEALYHSPLTADDLGVVAKCLADFGITQMQLAAWWGLKRQHYGKLRYGQKPIPLAHQDRLRVLFGLQPVLPVVTPSFPREPGKIPLTPKITALLNGEVFGHAELKSVLRYLRWECNIQRRHIAKWLGITVYSLDHMACGRRRSAVKIRWVLRALFAQEGGATTN